MDSITLASEISRTRSASARAIARADAGEQYADLWRSAGEQLARRSEELADQARARLTTDADLPAWLALFSVTL